MKRVLLLCASMLIGLTTASATELNNPKPKIKLDKKKNFRFAQPIVFMERGIEFLIFPDGSFDFNTHINDGYFNDTYYKGNSKRSNVNRTYKGSKSKIKYTSSRYPNNGVSISRDRNGKVRRIGNVHLNYDRHGRITRTGSIFMNYNRGRHSDLSRVGGLMVKYNRWGEIVNTRGFVNRYNRNHDFGNTRGNGNGNNNNHDDDWYDDVIYKNMGMGANAGGFERRLYKQSLRFYKSRKGGSILQTFYDAIPIAMFFLLPIFALILKILYRKQGLYAHHLVFSFYFFSFLFTVFSIVLAVNFIVDIPDWIDWLVVFSTFVYLFLALKRFYQQGIFKTFFKTSITSFLFLLLVAPLTAFLLAMFAFMFY